MANDDSSQEVVSEDTYTNSKIRQSSSELEKKRQKELEKNRIATEKKELRDKITAEREKKKAEFKDRLSKIRDERKRNIVSKANEKMSRVNKNRTDHWKKVLVKLNDHLDKIKTRRDELKNTGKDTSEVDSAIVVAEGKISTATDAVNAQALKEYVLTIGDEAELKNTVDSAIKTEQADLKIIQDLVEQARKSVKDSITNLMKLRGEKSSEVK